MRQKTGFTEKPFLLRISGFFLVSASWRARKTGERALRESRLCFLLRSLCLNVAPLLRKESDSEKGGIQEKPKVLRGTRFLISSFLHQGLRVRITESIEVCFGRHGVAPFISIQGRWGGWAVGLAQWGHGTIIHDPSSPSRLVRPMAVTSVAVAPSRV